MGGSSYPNSNDMPSPGEKNSTSWGGVAEWYAGHLEGEDTYHAKVVLPNTLRVLAAHKDMRVLDLACGEGLLTRALLETGTDAVGSDVSPELIALAKAKSQGRGTYHVSPSNDLAFARAAEFDAVVCVLALQNMERPEKAVDEVARIVKPGGSFIIVLNHPVLRVPKRSSWGFDAQAGLQYRRLDGYYLPSKERMLAHPSQGDRGGFTWSFHRPLEVYAKLLFNRGFVLSALEEWLSHKTSESGPRKAAEDRSRKEFPLFMMLQARKLPLASVRGQAGL